MRVGATHATRIETGKNLMSKRATGRTTRMLQDAKRLADQGRAVYIVTASPQDTQRIQAQLQDSRINVNTARGLGNVDWESMTLRGAHPNCVLLFDHYAIESRFGNLLSMLHAYEGEVDGKPSV